MDARLGLVGMIVEDMATTLDFYRQLGLDVPPEADREPHVHITLDSGLLLAWDTVDVIRSFTEWTPPSGGQRVTLAFHFDSPAEVDAAYAKLVALGHPGHKEPWDAFWGQRYAIILDPDGNHVDLFAPTT